jgi:hypothetical protein
MIDDRRQVKALLQQMKKQLPIPVLATDVLARSMRRQLPELKRQRQLSIKSVLYSGDEGGILCDITPDGAKSVVLCSLTQLEILADHPLAAEIQAYQHARTRKLAARGLGKPQRFTIRP